MWNFNFVLKPVSQSFILSFIWILSNLQKSCKVSQNENPSAVDHLQGVWREKSHLQNHQSADNTEPTIILSSQSLQQQPEGVEEQLCCLFLTKCIVCYWQFCVNLKNNKNQYWFMTLWLELGGSHESGLCCHLQEIVHKSLIVCHSKLAEYCYQTWGNNDLITGDWVSTIAWKLLALTRSWRGHGTIVTRGHIADDEHH